MKYDSEKFKLTIDLAKIGKFVFRLGNFSIGRII